MNRTPTTLKDALIAYIEWAADEDADGSEISPETLAHLKKLARDATPELTSQSDVTRSAAPARMTVQRTQPGLDGAPARAERHASEPVQETLPAFSAADKPTSDEPVQIERRQVALDEIAARIERCTNCDLFKNRNKCVPGQGAVAPDILFIGEGPGEEENRKGEAFVGRAGGLLTKMIESMGETRSSVFIANIVKCHPPNNRAPLPNEMNACMPFIREQIKVLRPRVIVALGGTATHGLLGETDGITRLRGKWFSYEGIPVMPTFHPAFLLRNASAKRPTWEDLKQVLRRLDRPIPEP